MWRKKPVQQAEVNTAPQPEEVHAQPDERIHFANALTAFSLAHNKLVSFRAVLAVQEIQSGVSNLSAATQQLSATTEEVSASAEEITSATGNIAKLAASNLREVDELQAMEDQTNSTFQNMVQTVKQLSGEISKINDITQSIIAIASQTNLLSLNAAIEAAHAGDAGRGFAVVADEVRRLSNNTSQSVQHTLAIANEMTNMAKATAVGVGAVQEQFEQYITRSHNIKDNVNLIDERLQSVADALQGISQAMQEQAGTSNELATTAGDVAGHADTLVRVLQHESNDLSVVIDPHISIPETGSLANTLALRLVDHANYLQNALTQAGKRARLAAHTECNFGKWYQANREKHSHIQAYLNIDFPHRAVHEAAQALSDQCTADNAEHLIEASIDLLREYTALYNALTTDLN